MQLFSQNHKIRLNGETIGLLNKAEESINHLAGALSIFNDDHFITKILQLRESIESLSIDDFSTTLKDFFTSVCLNESDKIKLTQNLLAASLLGTSLIKNVARPEHIIKSIYKKLIGNQDINDTQTNIYRSKRINGYSIVLPHDIQNEMELLGKYIVSDISYPPLINTAIIHAKFEQIHPFESMNGVVGRILIHLQLQWKNRLTNNYLQISRLLNKNKQEYFERLSELESSQNWNEWIKFFLLMLIQASNETNKTIKDLFDLEKAGYRKIISSNSASTGIIKFYEHLFYQPVISIPYITETLQLSKQTANIVVSKLIELNLINEITGKQRYRIYEKKDFLDLLN